MKKILNFISILGVLGICIKYFFADKISVGFAGACLVGAVILAALDKPVWQFAKAGVALISFILLMASYTYNMKDFISLLQPILTLLIALFGIYLIVRSFFKSGNSSDEQHFIYNKKTGRLKKKNSLW
jgi:ABC-type nickel/cobalt efflux system permease component RcnA